MEMRITGQQKTTIKNLYGLLAKSNGRVSVSSQGSNSLEVGNLKPSFSEYGLKRIFYIRQLDNSDPSKVLAFAKIRKTRFGNFKLMNAAKSTSDNKHAEPNEPKKVIGSLLSVLSE